MKSKSLLFENPFDIEQIYTHIKCGFHVLTIFIIMIKKALLIPVYLVAGYIFIVACSLVSIINSLR
jgi:hypothetical protein